MLLSDTSRRKIVIPNGRNDEFNLAVEKWLISMKHRNQSDNRLPEFYYISISECHIYDPKQVRNTLSASNAHAMKLFPHILIIPWKIMYSSPKPWNKIIKHWIYIIYCVIIMMIDSPIFKGIVQFVIPNYCLRRYSCNVWEENSWLYTLHITALVCFKNQSTCHRHGQLQKLKFLQSVK